jgi:hypothetical protein
METSVWGFGLNLPDTFGDTGREWTEGRAVVWKALQMGATVDPPTGFDDDCPNFGWWLGLVDLVGFGMGIDDVVGYLKQLGSPNRSASNIEGFIRANWGDSVAVLELYMMLYPQARQAIYDYVRRCKGVMPDAQSPLSGFSAENLMLTGSYAAASIRSDKHNRLAGALIDRESILVEHLRDTRPGDPSHLSAHFSFLWADGSTELEPSDTIQLLRHRGAVLFVESYAGWYGKIHALRRDCERDPEAIGDVDRVEVKVAGLGSIGTFVFDESRQCFVLEGEETPKSVVTTSPRYGFSLTQEMAGKLVPLLEMHDSLEDEPIEHVELQIRREVDLAHSLTYEIGDSNSGDGDWTRINGGWVLGFMVPDGKHHKRCLSALVDGDHLDLDLPMHQAVIEDSDVYDVAPWALKLILGLWDAGVPIRTLFGKLSGLSADTDVSIAAVDQETEEQIQNYVDSLGKFISPDSDFLIEELLEWQDGLFMTAKGMLEAIVEAESHR